MNIPLPLSNQKSENHTPAPPQTFKMVMSKPFMWLHIVSGDRDKNVQAVTELFPSISSLDIYDCTSKNQVTKYDVTEEYSLLILQIPSLIQEFSKVAYHQIGIFILKDGIITISDVPFQPLEDFLSTFTEDSAEYKKVQKQNPSYLLYKIFAIIEKVVRGRVKDTLSYVSNVEQLVLDPLANSVREVIRARTYIAYLRRMIVPLLQIVEEYHKKVARNKQMSTYYRDIRDHIKKAVATINEAKETIEIYKDSDYIINTEESNRILSILTIAFTFSIPATLFGTFYGMNIPLPGGIETGPWNFFGEYTTFAIILFSSLLTALLMYLYFKAKRWM